jgi:hypothetical protein
VLVVHPGGHLVGSGGDGVGQLGGEHPDLLVHARGRRLDEPERADLGALEAAAGDREVLDGALGLRAPQCVDGHLDLAHRVVLDPEPVVGGHGPSLLPRCKGAQQEVAVTTPASGRRPQGLGCSGRVSVVVVR